MTSLVERTVPVHNMHATPINYDSFPHLSQPNLSGTQQQELYYQSDSSAGILAEVRHFQEAGDGEESGRYPVQSPAGDTASLKRKDSGREDEPSSVKLREDVFTPPQSKCGRLQIEIPGKNITIITP